MQRESSGVLVRGLFSPTIIPIIHPLDVTGPAAHRLKFRKSDSTDDRLGSPGVSPSMDCDWGIAIDAGEFDAADLVAIVSERHFTVLSFLKG